MTKTILGKIGLISKGDYNDETSYKRLDFVKYNGSSFVALKDNQGITPNTDDRVWQLLAIKGEKGDKPINGTDYNTAQEKEEFKTDIVNNATFELESYIVDKKTELNIYKSTKEQELNDYTTAKKMELDSQSDSLTDSFNANASNNTKSFNDNASLKLKEYNDNSASKTTDFNDNSANKLNDYNSNASSKLEGYNTNADNRLNDYNVNANLKVQEYNANAEYLTNLVSQIALKGTKTGNSIHITDAIKFPLINAKINGKTYQETTKGINLYNIDNMAQLSIAKVVDDDCIEINYDNSQGTSTRYAEFHFGVSQLIKLNTNYTVIAEVIDILGDGTLRLNSTNEGENVSQFSIGHNFLFKNLFKGQIIIYPVTSLENFDNAVRGLRSNVYFTAGQSGYLKLRISIIEGEVAQEDFKYESYTGGMASPNPGYPQEIKVINEISATINDESIQIDLQNNVITGYDELNIDLLGNMTLIKNTGKIDSYIDEEITSEYISSTGQLSEGATIYYKLDEPEIINLGKLDSPIMLKDGNNDIELASNLDTNIEITYAIDTKKYIDSLLTTKTSEVIDNGES